MAKKRTKSVRIASPEETSSFIERLQKRFKREPRSATEKKEFREYLGKVDNERLRSLMRRALITMVQHPAEPARKRPSRTPRKSRSRKSP